MKTQQSRFFLLLLATWGIFFIVLFTRIIYWKSGALYVGHENVWSDWALHLGLATTFADKSPDLWFAYHPIYADGKLTYPFLSDLISGLMMRLGFSIPQAFIIPSILFALLLISFMYQLFIVLGHSARRAYLAISIFFLSSGFGFIQFIKDYNGLSDLILPLKQYSRLDSNQWFSGNSIVGLLLPQRSILLGMTLAMGALLGFFSVLLKNKEVNYRDKLILICSGIAVGILPIVHMHTFIALLIIMSPVVLINYRKWQMMIYCLLPAILLSGLLYSMFLFGNIEARNFISWVPGYSVNGFGNWIVFWAKAWGVMIPLAITGWALLKSRISVDAWIFFSGFFILFLVANLFHFQPVTWDNSKLFTWCYFGFSYLAVEVIARLWQLNKLWSRVAAICFIILLTFTGVLELVLLQRVDAHSYKLIGSEEIQLADEIRNKSAPLARFLTGKDHNSLVMVRGARPILLGYTAWVGNFGFNYSQTEHDIDVMYKGGNEALALLKKHKISYVLIGPSEVKQFHPNELFFKARFPISFQSLNYRVYDVRSLL